MIITNSALAQIKKVTPDKEYFRMSVVGGGCSGMSYKLSFDQNFNSVTDKLITQDGVSILVDKKSYLYINNIELDYIESLNKTGWLFNNPAAKRSCGCGESFS